MKSTAQGIDALLSQISKIYGEKNASFIKEIYHFSEKAHKGQFRRSGEGYIHHPVSVASILTDLKLDINTIATGLLHDTVEDTDITLEDIKNTFGEDLSHLVDGVTKISQINFRNTNEKQGENFRKIMIAMGKDIRVILVKIADRLHNMRTLNHMPYYKQEGIAQETKDIYAPLAGRLGINEWKIELEDLSFRYLKPDCYYDLVQKVSKKQKGSEKYIQEFKSLLKQNMKNTGIDCEVYGRSKHLYSIYKKMTRQNIAYEQVYDLLGFRILVDNVSNCYEVLGVVHSLYKPIPGRFKDFIAMAKVNNYQSLHTTVVGPSGEQVEIQIRTHRMHLVAEKGIAAHWKYKEGALDKSTIDKFDWLRDLLQWDQEVRDPGEFLETVKTDLFETEIYVFTPQGDVKELPDGATPIDFSFSIHTDVGLKTIGAKVNGKMVSLKYKLQSGDTVEILTSSHQTPSKDWLNFCVTSRARSKIRSFVKIEENKRSTELGQEILEKAFRKHGVNILKVLKGPIYEKFIKDIGANSINDIYLQVGYGKITSEKVVERLAPQSFKTEERKPETFLDKVFKGAKKRTGRLISVSGLSDIIVRYAKCCHPIPGDEIMGFISRGRGVTIHQSSCPKVFEIDSARRVDVEWKSSGEVRRMTKIRVVSMDEPGLLKLISEVFTNQGVNIQNAQIRTNKDHKAICLFDVMVNNKKQVVQVIQKLQKIDHVLHVDRINFS